MDLPDIDYYAIPEDTKHDEFHYASNKVNTQSNEWDNYYCPKPFQGQPPLTTPG